MNKNDFMNACKKGGSIIGQTVHTNEVLDLRNIPDIKLTNIIFEAVDGFVSDCAISSKVSDNPIILVSSDEYIRIGHGKIENIEI